MRKIIEERSSGSPWIIKAEGFEKSSLESFHKAGVGIFFAKPLKCALEKMMKRFQMCIRFGDAFDLLREIGGCEQARVGLPQARMALSEACFFEVMECGSSG